MSELKEKPLKKLPHHYKQDGDGIRILQEMSEAPTPVMEIENQQHFQEKSKKYLQKTGR